MSSITGKNLKISLFGESHGKLVGIVADGLPSGFRIEEEKIYNFTKRRRPSSEFTTKRREDDEFEIVSGLYNGYTTGTPLTVLIKNKDKKSKDYEYMKETARPSHADYTGYIRYDGFNDPRGGGHFSGRLTAPVCVIGAIAIEILKEKNIEIFSHIKTLYDIVDKKIEDTDISQLLKVREKEIPFIEDENIKKAKKLLSQIQSQNDSVGGIAELMIKGMKAGVGDPFFDSVESQISKMIFSVPSVKAIEFGLGFEAANKKGSQYNDSMYFKDGKIQTLTNNDSGINGGITNSMPIIFRVCIKPTASIGKTQKTVNFKDGKNCLLNIKGRHDPSIILRAVPVLEAFTAIAVLDMVISSKKYGGM